jgi:hypothetical protein
LPKIQATRGEGDSTASSVAAPNDVVRHACPSKRSPSWSPTKKNHLIDKDSVKIKDLEHALIEKAEQLFRGML